MRRIPGPAIRVQCRPSMILIGILCGFITAMGTSLSYVLNRHYVAIRGGGPVKLLVISHILMGLLAAIVLPFIHDASLPPLSQYALDLAGAAGFYLIGQGGLYVALRYVDASHVTPMLGFKIVIVALIMVVFFATHITLLQWFAVGLCVCSAFLLNKAGAPPPIKALLAILWTCLFYGLSDICIQRVVLVLGVEGSLRGPLFGGLMSYLFTGLFCAAMLPWHGSLRLSDWTAAGPYAAIWLLAMSLFFVAVSGAGIVLANIILATRGLLSIALGVILSRHGMVHLEKHVHKDVLLRRIFAALMMLAAITLWVLK